MIFFNILDYCKEENNAPLDRAMMINKEVIKLGIQCHLFAYKVSKNKKSRLVNRFLNLLNVLSSTIVLRPKAVLFRGEYLGVFVIILCKIMKIPVINDNHGLIYQEFRYRKFRYRALIFSFLENLCLDKCDYIISQNINTKKILDKKYGPKTLLIENGIDLEFIKSIRPFKKKIKKPLIGFIGNWEPWMNIEEFLEASRYVPSANFIVIGLGEKFKFFQSKYDNVIFTGRILNSKTISLLKRFDICVSPYSSDEIMKYKSTKKTLEYLATGKPVIVSDVEGKDRFLVEGDNCILYKPRDPKDLANKIKTLLENPVLIETMGRKNKVISNRYTWNKRIESSKFLKILQEICVE